MVPISYTTRFIEAVVKYLEDAGCKPDLIPKCVEYATYSDPVLQQRSDEQGQLMCDHSRCVEPQAQHKHKCTTSARIWKEVRAAVAKCSLMQKSTKAGAQGEKAKKGNHLVHNLSREQLSAMPLSTEELANMSAKQEELRYGRYQDGSVTTLELGIRHWYAFCNRTNLPRYLLVDTPAGVRAATAQAEAFLLYELGNFDQTGANVKRKMWAVDHDHQARRLPPPFKKNEQVREMLKTVVKADAPAKSKVPLTNRQMMVLRNTLDLDTREGFCLWTGLRFAIAFLSESVSGVSTRSIL